MHAYDTDESTALAPIKLGRIKFILDSTTLSLLTLDSLLFFQRWRFHIEVLRINKLRSAKSIKKVFGHCEKKAFQVCFTNPG